MPTFTIQLNVNVPGLGDKNVVETGIIAPSIEAAIAQVKAAVIVTTLAAQQTAP
jgi:hypothetical protein